MPRINPTPGIYLGGGGDLNKFGNGSVNAVIDELRISFGRSSEIEDVTASVATV